MTMLMRKEWRINPGMPMSGTLAERIMAGRGLRDPVRKAAFLDPSLHDLYDPFLLPDMAIACSVLATALTNRETIAIQGDYDVDGITATALLTRFFRRQGATCLDFIPDRMTDGYGLTAAGVNRILASGAKLLVTVDCGIASLDEISQLTRAGVQVIITDHHECRPQLPDALAVINPKRPDSEYPFRGLAGVGVALKLIQALCLRMDLGDQWQADLELAALGTVADVVPLLDENRIIVTAGLARMPQKRQLGLTALLETVNIAESAVTTQTFGYILAPRINAAGRLGNAAVALDLLLTEDPLNAAAAAASLVDLNRRRQEMEAEIMAEAVKEIDSTFDFAGTDLIIICRENWHQGVIGIVASRLAEQYCRPVIVLTGEEGQLRGSSRTWGDYDILAAISAAAEYTVKFGGHRKAAGLVVDQDRFDDFKRAVNEYAAVTLRPDQLRPILLADIEADPSELTLDNARALQQLAPFGEDNPQPLLICRNLVLSSMQPTGNGRHLKVKLLYPQTSAGLEGIAFGMGDTDDLYTAGDRVDVLFGLEINTWMGRSSVQMIIRDIKHSSSQMEFIDQPWIADDLFLHNTSLKALMNQYQLPIEELRPNHDEYKAVYQFIRARYSEQPLLADLSLLALRIARSYGISLNGFRLARILTVFHEISLISLQQMGADRIRLVLLPSENRVRLEDSPTYQRLQAEEGLL